MVVELLDEEAIFKVAVEIPSDDVRSTYLQQVCGNDRAMLDRVLALLSASSEARDFLESPPAAFAATATLTAVTATPGEVIGPYRLRELLAEGGMGSVFVAEQEQPVRRKVALKVIKPGMDSRQVLSRFEAERQTLALMDHPNIAKVLDAGTTDSGHPYFVMELVRGVPITEFCDQRRLEPRRRLELFVQVCRAIQHAHQKGIIHRDIKPSNILVTLHDDLAVSKVIDFGIAKATNQQLTEQSIYTAFSQLIGTPLYMSPEQAEMNALDVDTRSDVYSLGVLLYELLTGVTPFDGDALRQVGFDEMRRLIREVNPPRPSQRVSTLDAEALSTVSQSRGVDERRLGRELRGDLDWVVMKCLEKDRNRRYESASALAADVQRHLDGEPIQARPPRLFVSSRKWCRRHRTLVVSTAASVAALVLVSLIMLAWSNAAIKRERDEKAAALRDKTAALARAERNFQMVLAVINRSLESVGDQTLVDVPQVEQLRKKLLEDALEFYEKLVKENPGDASARFAAARVNVRVAMINQEFMEWDEAIRLNEKAIAVLEDLSRAEPTNASYRFELATALKQRSWNAMAIPSSPMDDARRARDAVELLQGLNDEFPDDVTYQTALLEVLLTLDEWNVTTEEKETLLTRMVPLADLPRMNKRLRGEVQNRIAALHQEHGRLDEAEVSYREAIRFHRKAVNEHPTEAIARTHLVREYNRLGHLLTSRGKLQEAVVCFGDSFKVGLSLRRDFPAMKHFDQFTLEALFELFKALQLLGRIDEATEVFAEWEVKSPADFLIRGNAYFENKQVEKAIEDFSAAIRLDPTSPIGLSNRGGAYHKLRHYGEAIDDYQAALAIDPNFWHARINLAWLLATADEDKFRDGKRAVELAQQTYDAGYFSTYGEAKFLDILAAAHAETGDFAKAIECSEKAIELTKDNAERLKQFQQHLANYQAGRPWRIGNDKK